MPDDNKLFPSVALEEWLTAHRKFDVSININFERRLEEMTWKTICWVEVMAPTDEVLDVVIADLTRSTKQIEGA